jgi:hypothetical protein
MSQSQRGTVTRVYEDPPPIQPNQVAAQQPPTRVPLSSTQQQTPASQPQGQQANQQQQQQQHQQAAQPAGSLVNQQGQHGHHGDEKRQESNGTSVIGNNQQLATSSRSKYRTYILPSVVFEVEQRYEIREIIGQGAYGVVW